MRENISISCQRQICLIHTDLDVVDLSPGMSILNVTHNADDQIFTLEGDWDTKVRVMCGRGNSQYPKMCDQSHTKSQQVFRECQILKSLRQYVYE